MAEIKQKTNSKNKLKGIVLILLVLSMIVYLTYDIIMTNIFSSYYCKEEPNPKTFINKTIENPISIYWEDNVYPGFSKEDRELMIINYLNGKNLKTMALNGDDGKIYVYSRYYNNDIDIILELDKQSSDAENSRKKAFREKYNLINKEKELNPEELINIDKSTITKNDIFNNKGTKAYWIIKTDEIKFLEKEIEKFENIQIEIAKKIKLINIEKIKDSFLTEQIYTKQTMPQMNYTVIFDKVKLSSLVSKFLYSDETKVIENSTNKILGFNRRYMRFFYKLHPDFVGRYYWYEPMCTDNDYGLEQKVFDYERYFGSSIHKQDLNTKLYLEQLNKKYIKGEK